MSHSFQRMCTHIPSFVLTTGPHPSAAWDEGLALMASSLWTTGASLGMPAVRSAPFPPLSPLTFSTVPLHCALESACGSLAVSPTARRQENLPPSQWSQTTTEAHPEAVFPGHNSCRFNVHCNPKLCSCAPEIP